MFDSLRVPNYRSYFVGLLVSSTGTWMSRTAQGWLVLMVLTHHDARALGLVTGLQFLPILLFSGYAGALADRLPKHRILLVTQVAMGVNALVLGMLVLTGHAQLWMVYAAAFVEGTAAALDTPTRQSFLSEIVSTEQLSNAIGLNSASFNTARLIGPGVAGLLIAAVGTGPVFLVNAATYVVVLMALLSMRRDQLHPTPVRAGRSGVVEGIRYVRSQPYLVLILVIAATMGFFGMNYQVTNVLMATEVFHAGAREYGMLGSVMAVGSLTAALLAARRRRPRLRLLMVAFGTFVVVAAASALAPTFWVFTALLVPTGFTAITVMITCNSLLQLTCDPAYRGRVMALYMMVFMGTTPIGAPTLGWVGDRFGARWTIGIGVIALAVTWMAVGFYLARRENLHIERRTGRPWIAVRRGLRAEDQKPASAVTEM